MSDAAEQDMIIVGYIAGPRGRDAVRLGGFIAAGTGAKLIVTMVVPESSAYSGTHPLPPKEDRILRDQMEAWMDEALALVPEGVKAHGEFRSSSSEARGLMAAAEEHGAGLIVIGAKASAGLNRLTIGSVASTLLHASPVPVALAPGGFDAEGPVRRLTTIYGTRPGSAELIGWSIERALRREVPLRLLSLVQVDRVPPAMIRSIAEQAQEFGGASLAAASVDMQKSGRATVEIVEGRDFEDAMSQVGWEPGDIAAMGSSRLAQRGRIFLGNRAMRIMRVLTVPVIVVPRELEPEGE